MDFYRSILKQTDVSLMLAKHVFFSKIRQPNANMVLSPLSIQKVLGMIAAGSKGRSLDQLLSFLKFNSIEELNYVSSRVITDVFADGSRYGGPRLSVAHGVWIDKTLSFKPSFKQIMDNVYKAGCSSIDFLHKADEARAEVNKWAEEKTNCLIKEILPPGAVDYRTSLILANALYFKGAWYEKFNASDTKDDEFHLLNEGSVQAPFMTSQKKQYVKAFNGFKVLKLPYEQGYDRKQCFSMYLFLPNARDGLPTLLDKISSEPGFVDQHIPLNRVKVSKFLVPKFKICFGIEASEVLKGLGVTAPFISGLTEMADYAQDLFVDKVFHKSYIEVNEEGTEAAAATAGMIARGMTIRKEVDFVADHPFLFLIREDATGAVLFVGSVLNPMISN